MTTDKTDNKKQIEYFAEVADMYKFLDENPQYKMIQYKFTFAYGYQLVYTEKEE